jgi:hypothetical protein
MASDLIVWKEEGDEHVAYIGRLKIGAVFQTIDWHGYVEGIWHNRKVD